MAAFSANAFSPNAFSPNAFSLPIIEEVIVVQQGGGAGFPAKSSSIRAIGHDILRDDEEILQIIFKLGDLWAK